MNQRGVSLAELLVVVSLIGIIAVALAPLDKTLLHAPQEVRVAERPAPMSLVVRRLIADARSAISVETDSGGIEIVRLGGERATWRQEDGVLLRNDRLCGVGRLDIVRRRSDFLVGTYTSPDGNEQPIEVWLRHLEKR